MTLHHHHRNSQPLLARFLPNFKGTTAITKIKNNNKTRTTAWRALTTTTATIFHILPMRKNNKKNNNNDNTNTTALMGCDTMSINVGIF